MEFGLLGPLTVSCDGQLLAVSSGSQRTILAALLMRANQMVTAYELIEAIWSGDPPPSARPTLHNYVKRIRAGLGAPGRQRLLTCPGGYQFAAGEQEIDVAQFRALVREGLAAAQRRDWQRASETLGTALERWRGPALADVPSQLLARQYVPGLDELRWQAAEARAEAELHLGRHQGMITGLLELIGAEPLRERPRELLMLALYRAGRRADALKAYQDAYQILNTELGMTPGPALRDLHHKILRSEPA